MARLAAAACRTEIAQHLFLTMKAVQMHLGRCHRRLGIGARVGPAPDPAGAEA